MILELNNNHKKPIKLKFMFTCKIIRENHATGEINENYGYFHSLVNILN